MFVELDYLLKTYSWIIPLLAVLCTFITMMCNFINKMNPFGGYKVQEINSIIKSSENILDKSELIFTKNIIREKVMEYSTGISDKELRRKVIFICVNSDISFNLLKKVKDIIVFRDGVFTLKITISYLVWRYISILYGAVVTVLALMCAISAVLSFALSKYPESFFYYIMALATGILALYSFTRYPCGCKIKEINSQLALLDMDMYLKSDVAESSLKN